MKDGPAAAEAGSFSAYMESSPSAFAVTRGPHHILVYANAAFRELPVVTGDLKQGSPISCAFDEPAAVRLSIMLDHVAQTGVVSRSQPLQPGHDGVTPLSCTVWPDSSEKGKVRHLVIELRDATTGETTLMLQREVAERMLLSALHERDLAEGAEASSKRAESVADEAVMLRALAESANEAKSVFLGTMSHELRTPLNAIGGYTDLIDMGLHGPVTIEQHVALGRIKQSQQHLVSLVADILNYVRIGAGGVVYDIQEVGVGDVLGAAVALAEPMVREKRLVFEGVSCDSTFVARADAEKLKQIVVNLLSNAIKFTEPGGRLAIECRGTDLQIAVSVTDTGMGIPSEKLESIFDAFVQVRGGLAGRDSGVGLGLSISRDLARGMGGNIVVESVVGAGSTFTLTLPRAH